MASGYIYILSNAAMPNLYKIGCTTKDAVTRAAELYTTGVPSKFEVLFSYWVCDELEEMEAHIHYCLRGYRWSDSREFFRFDKQRQCLQSVLSCIVEAEHGMVVADEDAVVHKDEWQRCELLECNVPSLVFTFLSDDEIITATHRFRQLEDIVNSLPQDEKNQLHRQRWTFEMWDKMLTEQAHAELEAK